MRPSVPDVHITDAQDAEFSEYRAIAPQSVLALICGLLAPLAMVDSMLWSIPILGVLFSCWALRRIKAGAPAITGRKMALFGLTISLLFLVAAPTDWLVYRRMVADEARVFADQWFHFMTHDEPQKAYQLTTTPQTRQPLNNRLWSYYRHSPKVREQLETYVKSPVVRTLLALGPKAQVRFDQIGGQSRSSNNDEVDLWYAVTYEEQNEKKSFFILVRALRSELKSGGADWRILQTEGGGRPRGW
jgi:hypothetical protein